MRVALFHIPKTGGTSLHQFLAPRFAEDKVCPERFRNFDRFRPARLRSFDYFSAHMDFACLSRIPGPLYTITILREPKARILSLYHFWRAHTWEQIERGDLVGPRRAKELDLGEFLKLTTDGVPGSIDNVYARSLLGSFWTGPQGRLVLSDQEALRVSMRNLLTIDTIGFTEDMPGLFRQVTRRLGIEMPERLPWAWSSQDVARRPSMETVARQEVTPEIDARLDVLTRLDRVIYENARRMFSEPRVA